MVGVGLVEAPPPETDVSNCLTRARCSARSVSSEWNASSIFRTSALRLAALSAEDAIPAFALRAFKASSVWFKRART